MLLREPHDAECQRHSNRSSRDEFSPIWWAEARFRKCDIVFRDKGKAADVAGS
jgi:hypothetical protein